MIIAVACYVLIMLAAQRLTRGKRFPLALVTALAVVALCIRFNIPTWNEAYQP